MLSGCTSFEANSNYVLIEPVKYVAAPATPCPNCKFGWVTTSSEDAERFRVRIGEQKYHDLIRPYLVNGGITNEKAVSVAAAFAEQQVAGRGLCKVASVPADSRKLMGPQGPWEIWMYVECRKSSNAGA